MIQDLPMHTPDDQWGRAR